MKKRTKEENRAYSKLLRDRKKAIKLVSARPLEEKCLAPEPIINNPGQYIEIKLTPAQDEICAECVALREDIARLDNDKATRMSLEEARISGLNTVIRDQAAEIIELRQTISALKAEAENIRPPAAPVKVKVGADDKTLFDRVMEAKINRFGRNTSIGSVR